MSVISSALKIDYYFVTKIILKSLLHAVVQDTTDVVMISKCCQFLLPGGRDCFSFSALSESVTQSVYRYLLQRTLNFVTSPVFLIFTAVICFVHEEDERNNDRCSINVSQITIVQKNIQVGSSNKSRHKLSIRKRIW